jgi:murein L,D-transpeptidase YafK
VASRSKRIAARLVGTAIIAAAAAGLGGCSSALYEQSPTPRTGKVRELTLRAMSKLHMERSAPILIRISYPICKFSGNLGPKLATGDHQAPEGFYDITPEQMNPTSSEYLAFNTGFPNAYDRSLGRTGSELMVHGGCRSVGCYAMTDDGIEEIYGLVDEAFKSGQEKVQLEAFPFRMTAQNLARHASDPNAPFWKMLKTGSDAFHAVGRPPTVAVCDRRYVFNPAVAVDDLNPTAPCPHGIDSKRSAHREAAAMKLQTGESPATEATLR